MNLVNALVAALTAAVLLGAILLVSFPPPKPHPGNHRGRPVPLPVRPVLVVPGINVAARAGQPEAYRRYTGRAIVSITHQPKHVAIEAGAVSD